MSSPRKVDDAEFLRLVELESVKGHIGNYVGDPLFHRYCELGKHGLRLLLTRSQMFEAICVLIVGAFSVQLLILAVLYLQDFPVSVFEAIAAGMPMAIIVQLFAKAKKAYVSWTLYHDALTMLEAADRQSNAYGRNTLYLIGKLFDYGDLHMRTEIYGGNHDEKSSTHS